MDVRDWLRSLGLERYEAAFRENAVDAEVLPTLTADDLKEMGVVPIGHRRRLLDAIAALRSEAVPDEASAQVSSSPALTEPTTQPGASETTAERRPLSVMFCDLIGSTALSARAADAAFGQRQGSIGFNPVSQKLQAVQVGAKGMVRTSSLTKGIAVCSQKEGRSGLFMLVEFAV